MNYLAHAWLSFNRPEILVGNMVSDFVKGKKRFDYSQGIQKGITLHRNIDEFTDAHAATKQAKQFLKPAAGLYAGAFIDIVYDHFLANDVNEFEDETLLRFSLSVYAILNNNLNILPGRFPGMLHYMMRDNWLYNYKKTHGIQQSFTGLSHRAKYLENNNSIFEYFEKNYDGLKACYNTFFPEVKEFAFSKLAALE